MLLLGAACDDRGARRAGPFANAELNVNSQSRNSMQLSVKLRDGFRNSGVSIRVDDVEVYRKSAVSTDLTISFADKVDLQVQRARVSLAVAVDGGPSGSVEVSPGETPFVDVAIIEGVLSLRATKTETPIL